MLIRKTEKRTYLLLFQIFLDEYFGSSILSLITLFSFDMKSLWILCNFIDHRCLVSSFGPRDFPLVHSSISYGTHLIPATST